jgi:hypothetical protein
MINRFMISVAAAALIAGTSFAYAQGTGTGHEAPSAAAPASGAAQPSAPAADRTGSAPASAGRNAAERTTPPSGAKAAQSESKSPAAGTNQRAEDNMQDRKSPGMATEGRDDRNGMKAEGPEDRNGMKAEGPEDRKGMKAEGREGRSETVGQAGAGAKLSGEQRTQITSVIRDERVRPVEHVNFAISVGTRVPRDVEFHPLPERIVTIYPDWRGYEFFLVGDQIVVVDPHTFEIVAVLEA